MPRDGSDDAAALHRRPVLRWAAGLEQRFPGANYGVVLLLLLTGYAFMASGPTGRWVPLVNAVVQGATLIAALVASEARPQLLRVGLLLTLVALIGGVVAVFGDVDGTRGASALLSLMLVAVAPVAVARAIWRRRVIDVHTVLGAVCIYVFIGIFFSFLFLAVGSISSHPFFAQQATATSADYLYFSFVTMTTVGYGDLTARGGLGRAAAVMEALFGQVYLVTVVALLVSQLARRGRGPGQTGS
jgi:hypothetical protein